MTIFDPSMPTSEIQATVDAIAAQQVSNEMGTKRYALLFKPGHVRIAAEPLNFQVGYYTEVAGLGASPTDVTINGKIDVYNRCLGARQLHRARATSGARCPTSRINVAGKDGCRARRLLGGLAGRRRCAASTSTAATSR